MPLSNSQYDEIFRKYDEKQLASQHQLERRTKDVYARIPALKEIDDAIATCSVEQARRLLDGDEAALATLREKLSYYRRQKEQLLQEHGLTSDYLKPVYHCPDCKDTGYVNGRRCHCFEQAAINLVYTQSNLKEILERENFSTFSFDYYSADDINPATGRSSLETARDAVAKCHDFIDHFDSTFSNLYLYGDTGIGKTFLSNCIAKELLDSSHSVIYLTAVELFDAFGNFNDEDDDEGTAVEYILDCDLLIIDDLGTELSNSFTNSKLFYCINERMLKRRATIISTNLSLGELSSVYSERLMSRITSTYTILKVFGKDIRLQKRSRQLNTGR